MIDLKKKIKIILSLGLLLISLSVIIWNFNNDIMEVYDEIPHNSQGFGIYWVKEGAKGDGTSESSPAGNITYILSNYDISDKVIKVKEGLYDKTVENFELIIDKENVTIKADGSQNNTIIKADGEYGFRVQNNSITIVGFTFQNCSTAIYINGGLSNQLSNISIRSNKFINNTVGIATLYAESCIIKGNEILNSTSNGSGISMSRSKDIIINLNKITGCYDAGINFRASNILIQSN
ncbi:MAG: hypothetical protein GF317_04240, partial [Candidatus Lokiarchaeota archaeon]|nr:hypothetical protein [Candidatus Lokiarchaeota archaeon]MBD3199098.1 hypothetical protein [Candidatus Lokiarchaeota archaeon]